MAKDKIKQIDDFMSNLELYIKKKISAATAKYDSSVQNQQAGYAKEHMEKALHILFDIEEG